MEGTFRPIEILSVPIFGGSSEDALGEVERVVAQPEPAVIAYVNAHTLNLAHGDRAYRDMLRSAALVLNDGIGLALAARLHGRRFPENLNGSDFNPKILGLAARRGWSVYFLGGAPGVAVEAAARLQRTIPGLQIVGSRDGYFERAADLDVAREVARSGADLLMVAMGNPLQEAWLTRNLQTTGCRAGIGVGAFFDFQAGRVARAPAWLNRAGLEWVWRLAQEPRRLWRRYVVGNPLFLARVVGERLRGRRS